MLSLPGARSAGPGHLNMTVHQSPHHGTAELPLAADGAVTQIQGERSSLNNPAAERRGSEDTRLRSPQGRGILKPTAATLPCDPEVPNQSVSLFPSFELLFLADC